MTEKKYPSNIVVRILVIGISVYYGIRLCHKIIFDR